MTPLGGARILLVEDDPETAAAVVKELAAHNHRVSHMTSSRAALEFCRRFGCDLLIIDRVLPDGDGLSVLATLRTEGCEAVVLVLSGLGAVDDRVRGLKAGGDDYLPKPFALSELAARVEALLRRAADPRSTVLRVGPLELDLIGRKAQRGGRPIALTPREYSLLEYLMRHASTAVSRERLLQDVWHYRRALPTNLVDVHMGKLRRKVDAAGEPPMIRSIRAVGFVLGEPG